MDSLQRKLPYSVEAEQSVLGCAIIDPEKCFDNVAQIIKSDDFYVEVHRDIFDAIYNLRFNNKAADLITIVNALIENGVYKEESEAYSYIKLLVDITPSVTNVMDYAKIVYDKSVLRRLIEASELTINDAYEQSDSVENIVDLAEQRVFEIAQKNEKRDFVHIKEVVFNTYNHLRELQNLSKDEIVGLQTGYTDLDKVVVGFGKGDLVIVGARPGVGKTSFCLNLATNIAKSSKKSVCIFSLEMSSEQLVSRILSSEALVESGKLRTGELNDQEWEKIANAASILAETNIYIDDTTDVSITAMKAKLRRVKNLGLVVVDYLQLMESEKKRKDGSRVNEIADISRGLKILAKELNVPVITCSQLSRGTEKEKERKPMLSDLRDSGSIEQDADMVMFLSRDYYGNDPEKANLVDVIVAKNRHGGQGTVQMSWLGQYTKFSSLEEHLKDPGYQYN